MKNPKPNPEKGRGSRPLLKVLGKVAEYAIPKLLPLLLGGKSVGKNAFKRWQPKAGKRGK